MILRGRCDRDLQSVDRLDFVGTNFRERDVLDESVVKIALCVNGALGDAAEIADARERDVRELRQKVPHPLAAQRRHDTDDHTFADFETGDRFLRLRFDRLLPRDAAKRINDNVGKFGVLAFAEAGVLKIDWTNPAAPILAGIAPTVGECTSVTISNGRLYVADGGGGILFFK